MDVLDHVVQDMKCVFPSRVEEEPKLIVYVHQLQRERTVDTKTKEVLENYCRIE